MMGKTKTVFRYFMIMDYEKEAEFLREMHKKGWRFVRVCNLGFYEFEACEPEDVVYQLDYNPDGLKHQNEYIKMFQDCGWEYLQDFMGYSYFRKPVSQMDGDEAIFCDDDSRLDMIKRVGKGRILPLVVLFCCCIIPELLSIMMGDFENDAMTKLIIILLGTAVVLYSINFAQFGIKYYQFKKKIGR